MVRSQVASLLTGFSEAAVVHASTFLREGELTLEQKDVLRQASRLGVFLEILEELDIAAEARRAAGQSPFPVIHQITVN